LADLRNTLKNSVSFGFIISASTLMLTSFINFFVIMKAIHESASDDAEVMAICSGSEAVAGQAAWLRRGCVKSEWVKLEWD
jgi:hypothetical protein